MKKLRDPTNGPYSEAWTKGSSAKDDKVRPSCRTIEKDPAEHRR